MATTETAGRTEPPKLRAAAGGRPDQFCDNCGEHIGRFHRGVDEYIACSKPECLKAEREYHRAAVEDFEWRL